jgi:hypothetical protein
LSKGRERGERRGRGKWGERGERGGREGERGEREGEREWERERAGEGRCGHHTGMKHIQSHFVATERIHSTVLIQVQSQSTGAIPVQHFLVIAFICYVPP